MMVMLRPLMLTLALLLAVPAKAGPVCDAVWRDAARGRDLPVRIRLPDGNGRAPAKSVPVVLFSPGLGGGIIGGTLWGNAWAARGIAVIHLAHPGSDASVYAGAANADDLKARVRAAATGVQLQARVGDVSFILDELARRPREGACDLARLNLSRIGLAGHSMGAWTAQAVAGQRYFGAAAFRDPRIVAAIALSPSTLTTGDVSEAFGGIMIPFLSITGTADGTPKIARDAVPSTAQIEQQAQRTGPYAGMTPGRKYLIVFQDGDHMVFAGNLRRTPTGPDSHIQTVTARLSTAFWGMTLFGNTDDAALLASGLTPMLAAGDRFSAK
jgi:predicted dienelactone hydrolase